MYYYVFVLNYYIVIIYSRGQEWFRGELKWTIFVMLHEWLRGGVWLAVGDGCAVNFTTYLARLMLTDFSNHKRRNDTQCRDNNNNNSSNSVTLLSRSMYGATNRRAHCTPSTHSYIYKYINIHLYFTTHCNAHGIIALIIIYKLTRPNDRFALKSRGRCLVFFMYEYSRHYLFRNSEGRRGPTNEIVRYKNDIVLNASSFLRGYWVVVNYYNIFCCIIMCLQRVHAQKRQL